jgi:site-specific recombinase XerD
MPGKRSSGRTSAHPPPLVRPTHLKPALNDAGLDFHVRVHDLGHAHASWLLAGGADIQVVKERLGHGSLRTTEKYLHTVPDHHDTALNALRRTRTRATN